MKILTGALRGQMLHYSKNPHLRPTADKVRKALMDMLAQRLEGARVLDLFAGTGALGFEALSGGAESAVFVEKVEAQAKKIEDNIRRLGLSGRSEIRPVEAAAAMSDLERAGKVFDIIFVDPPYAGTTGLATLQTLAGSSLVHENSLIVWESAAKGPAPEKVGRLRVLREKDYGDTRIIIFKRV